MNCLPSSAKSRIVPFPLSGTPAVSVALLLWRWLMKPLKMLRLKGFRALSLWADPFASIKLSLAVAHPAVAVMAAAAVVTAVEEEMVVMAAAVVVTAAAVVVTAAAVKTPVSVDPVPVAGKTAVTVPAMVAVRPVAVMTTVAAVAVVAPPAAAAEMTIPVMEGLRADAFRGRRRATAGRPPPRL